MPTASTAGIASLNNLGDLTTTFTAPSSCLTGQGFVASGIANPDLNSIMIYAVDNCQEEPEIPKDCLPHGDDLSKLYETLDSREYATIINYYSPAMHCPHDWETVGFYAPGQHSNGSTATATGDQDPGIFSPTAFYNGGPDESTSFPYAEFFANMFTSALAPTETAVVCCPSGYSVDPYAGCYSNFPITNLADETACIRRITRDSEEWISQVEYTTTYEFWGVTTTDTGRSFVWPTETDIYSTTTITLDESGLPSETEDLLFARPTGDDADEALQGIGVVSPLYLVHGGDGQGGGGNDDGGNDDDNDDGDENQDGDGNNDGDSDENNDDDDNDDDDNAGRQLSPVTSWVPVAAVLTAWGVSFAAGFGALVAW